MTKRDSLLTALDAAEAAVENIDLGPLHGLDTYTLRTELRQTAVTLRRIGRHVMSIADAQTIARAAADLLDGGEQ